MIRYLSIALVSVLFVSCTGSLHSAIPPGYVSDQQLSKSPIIVVAKWEKVPWTEEPNRDKPFVARTKLRILRTVKGPKIEQEEIDLKLGWQISWGKDGEFLNSATSTNLLGDVDDVTVPCLWFLDRAKRVLQFIAGGQPVWPDLQSEVSVFRGPVGKCKVLYAEAERVWRIVGSEVQDLRSQAVAVYANLTGVEGDPNLRTLLSDSNANVRGTALGILLHHRDIESLIHCDQTIQGIEANRRQQATMWTLLLSR